MTDFRLIPSIDQLRHRAAIRALEARFGAEATTDAVRAAAADVRRTMAESHPPFTAADDVAVRIEALAAVHLEALFGRALQRVINATGVIVHTNLGRAPLADAAVARVAEIARGYSSLEYDVERGARGRRDVHAEPLLRRLTGAEAAVVVNNNAAATMLVLAALAAGREVIVSRGELVEIGGGFRVPDVMAQSGAILREVGTTNRTRAADYAAAITERTALILRVHPSNFRIEGFTERPELSALVAIGKNLNVPVVEDLGSGYLPLGVRHVSDPGQTGVRHVSDTGLTPICPSSAVDPLRESEPAVRASVDAGIDVCCFSGDKLLGGPQAGIIVGRRALVDRIRSHPLMRALRVDKLTYAALEATLAEHAAGRAATTVPVTRMLTMTADDVRGRAERFAARMNAAASDWRAEIVRGASAIGGGSAPGVELATSLVALSHARLAASTIESTLRASRPPIIARIVDDRVVFDLRTVSEADDDTLFFACSGVQV